MHQRCRSRQEAIKALIYHRAVVTCWAKSQGGLAVCNTGIQLFYNTADGMRHTLAMMMYPSVQGRLSHSDSPFSLLPHVNVLRNTRTYIMTPAQTTAFGKISTLSLQLSQCHILTDQVPSSLKLPNSHRLSVHRGFTHLELDDAKMTVDKRKVYVVRRHL